MTPALSQTLDALNHPNPRTFTGRMAIRMIVKEAKKSGLIKFHRARKVAQVPRGKTTTQTS